MDLPPLAIQYDRLAVNQAGHEIGSPQRCHHVLRLRPVFVNVKRPTSSPTRRRGGIAQLNTIASVPANTRYREYRMARGDDQKLPPGLLPVLKAAATGDTRFDLGNLDPSTIREAINNGLGAVLAHVSRNCADSSRSSLAGDIHAADLTARLLTADVVDAIGRILQSCRSAPYRPLLMKGAAMALLHYPAPHLRTMGDIDVCVPPEHQLVFEAQLRALGFVQTSSTPADFFAHHHHSMPFWHPEWRVWVEVHTRLFPPQSPLANDSRFALGNLAPQLQRLDVQGAPALVMSGELQLLYTCARWLEELNVERGIFPILDVTLLLHNQGHALNWDQVFAMLKESPAAIATAMHTMLAYLCRWDIIPVPREVLARLAAQDRHTNSLSLAILHRLITIFLIERHPYGRFLTEGNVRIIWSTLLRTPTPVRNLLRLPYHIAFPPRHPRRFDLAYAAGRLRSFLLGPAR